MECNVIHSPLDPIFQVTYDVNGGVTGMLSERDHLPERLKEIIEEFEFSEAREKVELLLYYSERMPDLPDELGRGEDEMQLVEECMTPVYVAAQMEDNRMFFYFDVPPESPTVRGFAAILAEGLDGTSPQEVLNVPNNFFTAMGLEGVLTMQRMNGISAILAYMKRLAARALEG
jgi:cysteine desulfuration protein SufE